MNKDTFSLDAFLKVLDDYVYDVRDHKAPDREALKKALMTLLHDVTNKAADHGAMVAAWQASLR